MAVSSKLFVPPTISAHDKSANRVYSAARWMIPLASRRVALDVLVACLDKGQPLDDALARHQGFAGLDPRDRAFVRLLLATTLRRLGEIDEVLGALIERPLDGANAAGRAGAAAGRRAAAVPRHAARMPPSTPRCG